MRMRCGACQPRRRNSHVLFRSGCLVGCLFFFLPVGGSGAITLSFCRLSSWIPLHPSYFRNLLLSREYVMC